MNRPYRIWIAFAVALAVVLAGMGWVSVAAVRMHRAQARADRQAAVQEKIRLALWRMESALTPLIAQEAARPYFVYAAFHPVDRAYTRMFAEVEPNAILVPSPLLTRRPEHILLHFQFGPDGQLTSPQAPTANQRDLAEAAYVSHEQVQAATDRLAELADVLARDELLARLPAPQPARAELAGRLNENAGPAATVVTTQPAAQPSPPQRAVGGRVAQQQALDFSERQQRGSIVYNAQIGRPDILNTAELYISAQHADQAVIESPIHAVWVNGALLLARRITVDGLDYVQGCWLDWAAIRVSLAELVADLLAEAELRPASGDSHADSDLLAAIPARLIPGDVQADGGETAWPIAIALALAWGCLLIGAAAVAVVLQTTINLSERRGAFVSAVSHELRTPLTTFRLYTDLLAAGAIPDETRRADYLRRLRDESERLAHLVENVLSYSRLSGRGSAGRIESVSVGQLLARCGERLTGPADRAGMSVEIDCPAPLAETCVLANVASVEQILANLIDNACKYAAGPGVIHVQARRGQGSVEIVVRDDGPGIARDVARRLFRPFSKPAGQAGQCARGVGLGLALSRRLAREMSGDLRLASRPGQPACFILILPLMAGRHADRQV